MENKSTEQTQQQSLRKTFVMCRFYLTKYEYNSKRFDWLIRRR